MAFICPTPLTLPDHTLQPGHLLQWPNFDNWLWKRPLGLTLHFPWLGHLSSGFNITTTGKDILSVPGLKEPACQAYLLLHCPHLLPWMKVLLYVSPFSCRLSLRRAQLSPLLLFSGLPWAILMPSFKQCCTVKRAALRGEWFLTIKIVRTWYISGQTLTVKQVICLCKCLVSPTAWYAPQRYEWSRPLCATRALPYT